MKSIQRRAGRPLSFDRDAVLQRAMLAFWQSGYETTSISELTSAMGVTAPSIYTAFGDKKNLFLEAMQLYAGPPEALQEQLDAAPTARAAAEQMLIGACTAFTGLATPRGCLLASATATGSAQSSDVQQAVSAVRAEIAKKLQARIEQDVSHGLIPRNTDSSALAMLVVALVQGMSVLARDGLDRDRLLTIARAGLAAWPTD